MPATFQFLVAGVPQTAELDYRATAPIGWPSFRTDNMATADNPDAAWRAERGAIAAELITLLAASPRSPEQVERFDLLRQRLRWGARPFYGWQDVEAALQRPQYETQSYPRSCHPPRRVAHIGGRALAAWIAQGT